MFRPQQRPPDSAGRTKSKSPASRQHDKAWRAMHLEAGLLVASKGRREPGERRGVRRLQPQRLAPTLVRKPRLGMVQRVAGMLDLLHPHHEQPVRLAGSVAHGGEWAAAGHRVACGSSHGPHATAVAPRTVGFFGGSPPPSMPPVSSHRSWPMSRLWEMWALTWTAMRKLKSSLSFSNRDLRRTSHDVRMGEETACPATVSKAAALP